MICVREKWLVYFVTAALAFVSITRAADGPLSISPEMLAALDKTELGDRYDSTKSAQYAEAHQWIEQYFSAKTTAERSQIAKNIAATGLDCDTLGRMCRLRADWPMLAPGVYSINEQVGPHPVRYFLGIPKKYSPDQSWPLMVKLPPANPFLTQPLPDADEVVRIYTQWITDELTNHPDALVLMPLLNLDDLYGPGQLGMGMVIQPILNAANQANIDTARIYLIGHSLGAQAAWNIALHYPTYFAAVNILAGSAREYWQRERMGNLRNVLPIIWHDANDPVIPVSDARELVQKLHDLKYDVVYDETKGLGHAPPERILKQEYETLRARSRDLYPTDVFVQSDRPETAFNRVDWVQIYQPIMSGNETTYMFSHGNDRTTIYQESYRIGAHQQGNTISLTIVNIQTGRLYLNDQMVDLSKPVTVTVNGKTLYNDLAKPDVEEMLKDQTFLGRGFRYYSAVIDLDLSQAPAIPRPVEAPASRPAGKTAAKPATQPSKGGGILYTAPDGTQHVYQPK
jgi:hypothetical protein